MPMPTLSQTPRFKHALCLNPYRADSTGTMGVFPPTGLEYIATSMLGLVGKVTLLDLRHEKTYGSREALCRFINQEIDLLCVSIRWRSRFDQVCELIRSLPPHVLTVAGGYKATLEVETLFERCPNIDVVVRGEGEEIIRQIVTGVPFERIRGLSYRRNGAIVHNEIHPLPDVATIPFPDRSLRRQVYRWTEQGLRITRHTFDTLLTTRGCPFKCKFCTFSLNPLGQKRHYTERPLDSVLEELRTITADVVMFADDNLFTNPARSEELCDRIAAEGLQKLFVAQARIDIARYPRLLEKARRAGFKLFLLGIESPHDRILAQLQKGFNQQQIRDALAVLTRHDVYLHGYFIYGNIGETEEEMLYIPRFAREIGLDSITFQKLRIEKYSPLKEIVEQTPGYYYEGIGGPVYSDRYDLRELKRIRNAIRKRFYTLPRLLHIARKLRRLGFVSGGDVGCLLLQLPVLAAGLAARQIRKTRRR